MSLKNILKSTLAVATIFSFTNANAKTQYNVGLGWGIGLFKFNDDREDSTFKGDIASANAGLATAAGVQNVGNVELRTTYKYVKNQPPRIPSLDFGFNSSMEDITALDRNFFWGVSGAIGWSKIYNSTGVTNPNAKYMNTGSTGLYFTINSKFGLENAYSKIYGLFGLTYAKTDVPFDILPFGYKVSDLATCVVFKPGSTLSESSLWNIPTIQGLNGLINLACQTIKVDDVSFGTYFLNFGAAAETKLTENVNFFVEYTYLIQLFKNKEHSVGYSVGANKGTFKGKIVTKDTQFIRAGARYYFN